MKRIYGTSLIERSPGGQPGNQNAAGPHRTRYGNIHTIGFDRPNPKQEKAFWGTTTGKVKVTVQRGPRELPGPMPYGYQPLTAYGSSNSREYMVRPDVAERAIKKLSKMSGEGKRLSRGNTSTPYKGTWFRQRSKFRPTNRGGV
jgi:hypothetical protein